MFAASINPSFDGRWTRVAPYAAVFTVAFAFFLSLFVLISTVNAGRVLFAAHEADAQAQRSQPAVIVNAPQPAGGFGG